MNENQTLKARANDDDADDDRLGTCMLQNVQNLWSSLLFSKIKN
jgi:hypothetical protein